MDITPTLIEYTPTIINVILTCVIAYAVIAQARSVRKQVELQKKIDERTLEREDPTLEFIPFLYGYFQPSEQRHFDGFRVTNNGYVKIIVIEIAFEDDRSTILHIPPIYEYKGQLLSSLSLPHTLDRGESFTVLYEPEVLKFHSTDNNKSETMRPLRPFCIDSLNNVYKAELVV